jgi:hypothetical protein
MLLFRIFIAVIAALTLAACAAANDGSDQDRHDRAGPYIGGSAGVGF